MTRAANESNAEPPGSTNTSDSSGHGKAPQRSSRGRIAKRLAALAFSLFLAMAVAEIGLRIFNPAGVKERASWHFLLWEGIAPSDNPELVWEHIPGYRRRLVGYDVAINSLGFRGEEIEETKPEGTFRILAVGDSMTFGMSCDQLDIYPEQIQRMLRDRYPERPVEFINAGVLAYTTLQEEALVREWVPRLDPDLVVLWWFHNDTVLTGAANPASRDEQLRTLLGWKRRTFKRRVLHAAYVLAPCTVALVRAATVGRSDNANPTYFAFNPVDDHPGWVANRASLERMIEFCTEREVPLLVYSFGRYEAVSNICDSNGVKYVTSVDRAGREHEEQFAVSSVDPHFNREGNAQVARTVFEAIEAFDLGSD